MCAAWVDERERGNETGVVLGPAAISLSSRGKTVKPVYGRCEKITCAECGRRRFGYTYEVTGRATRGKKEDKQT